MPPDWAVSKLHAAGIAVMNMVRQHWCNVAHDVSSRGIVLWRLTCVACWRPQACRVRPGSGRRYYMCSRQRRRGAHRLHPHIPPHSCRCNNQRNDALKSFHHAPSVVDICAGKVSSFTRQPVAVVAAGGIYDGRGLAMSLCYGAQARIPKENRKSVVTSHSAGCLGGHTFSVRN